MLKNFAALIFLLSWTVISAQDIHEGFCEDFSSVLDFVRNGQISDISGEEQKSIERRAPDGTIYMEKSFSPVFRFRKEYSNHLYKPALKLVERDGMATLDYYFDAGTSGKDAIEKLKQYEQLLIECSLDGWSSDRHFEYSFPYIEFSDPTDSELSVSIILMDNMDFSNPRYMINLQFHFNYIEY